MREYKDPLPELDLTGPLTVERVRAWRSEIETFFAGEWDQLQSLVRLLEEERWNDSASAHVDLTQHQYTSEVVSEAGEAESSGGFPSRGGPVSARRESSTSTNPIGGPSQNGSISKRLTELSRQLNQKLTARFASMPDP